MRETAAYAQNPLLFMDCLCLSIEKGMDFSMAKAGMRRPDPKEPHGTESNKKTHIPKNDAPPVPELQGKEKTGKNKA